MRFRLTALTMIVAFGVAPAAMADPCPGAPPFTDVSAGANYCTNTEWLKNRSITLGCVGTNFCPNDAVTRGAMALFMNRLGDALTPIAVTTDLQLGGIDLDAGFFSAAVNVCQTPDFAVTGFPRRAHLSGAVSITAGGPVRMWSYWSVSSDGGTTWTSVQGNTQRQAISAAGEWASVSSFAAYNMQVGTTYRFALSVARGPEDPNLNDATAGRCHLLAQYFNRSGTESPYDQAAVRDLP